jgi:hypothetical protein
LRVDLVDHRLLESRKKCRIDTEFVDALDRTAHALAQDLAQDFVDLRLIGLAPNRIAKFALDH